MSDGKVEVRLVYHKKPSGAYRSEELDKALKVLEKEGLPPKYLEIKEPGKGPLIVPIEPGKYKGMLNVSDVLKNIAFSLGLPKGEYCKRRPDDYKIDWEFGVSRICRDMTSKDSSKKDRIREIIYRGMRDNRFNRSDVLNAYETIFGEKIPITTICMNLFRLLREGGIEYLGMDPNRFYIYRATSKLKSIVQLNHSL
jgi:hypothetical protein